MSRFSNDAIEIHTTAESSAVVVGGITGFSDSLNSSVSTPDSATPYDLFHSIQAQSPDAAFSTEAIRAILDNVGFTGKCIASDGTHPGVRFYRRKHDPCGPQGRASGSVHERLTFEDGHLFIDSLSIPAGGNAVINLTAHATEPDYVTQPYVVAYNAALPSSPITNQQFTLGRRVFVGGTQITQVTNVSVAWNVNFEKPQYGGSIWPTLVDIQKIKALITITSDDMSILDASKIPRSGKACANANSLFELQRRQQNAGLYDISATEHILARFSGFAVVSRKQASGGGAGNVEIQVATLDDGTNEPITFATGVSIAPS